MNQSLLIYSNTSWQTFYLRGLFLIYSVLYNKKKIFFFNKKKRLRDQCSWKVWILTFWCLPVFIFFYNWKEIETIACLVYTFESIQGSDVFRLLTTTLRFVSDNSTMSKVLEFSLSYWYPPLNKRNRVIKTQNNIKFRQI